MLLLTAVSMLLMVLGLAVNIDSNRLTRQALDAATSTSSPLIAPSTTGGNEATVLADPDPALSGRPGCGRRCEALLSDPDIAGTARGRELIEREMMP